MLPCSNLLLSLGPACLPCTMLCMRPFISCIWPALSSSFTIAAFLSASGAPLHVRVCGSQSGIVTPRVRRNNFQQESLQRECICVHIGLEPDAKQQ